MEHANPAAIVILLFLLVPIAVSIRNAFRGKPPHVRRIAGIDAIDNAIGRSVEMGRPVSFTSGLTGVNPLLYACLGVLRHVARKCARLKSRLFIPCSDPEALVLTEATVQNAYRAEKRFSQYDPNSLRFLSEEQFAYASGYMGLVHREEVGAAFLFGRFAAESLILAEAGQQIGAVQVAATTSPEQVPFFLTSCDYTLIGEELFASAAYLSEDPVQVGSLRGQDIGKYFLAGLIFFGILEATLKEAFNLELPWSLTNTLQATWSDIL